MRPAVMADPFTIDKGSCSPDDRARPRHQPRFLSVGELNREKSVSFLSVLILLAGTGRGTGQFLLGALTFCFLPLFLLFSSFAPAPAAIFPHGLVTHLPGCGRFAAG